MSTPMNPPYATDKDLYGRPIPDAAAEVQALAAEARAVLARLVADGIEVVLWGQIIKVRLPKRE